jgi:hypothetical protein
MVEMSKDDGRPAIDAAHAIDGTVAPYAETGGMGLAKRDENGFIIEDAPLRADVVRNLSSCQCFFYALLGLFLARDLFSYYYYFSTHV